MDKNPNRPNKGRNKFNVNQFNTMNFPQGKRINQMMMNYENNLNNNFIQNEDYMSRQYYPNQNIYPAPIPFPQNKEQNIKNMFKMYQSGPKKNYIPYNASELMNFRENEMSLEDNPQIGNKKYNNKNKSRIQRKRKNINKSNKDLINNNNMEREPYNNRAISLENNYEEDIPEVYYEDNYNYPKSGRKKAITVEYNRNRNKKWSYRHPKLKYNDYNINNENNSDNYSISDNKNNFINNNIKTYNNKSNNISDIENDSNLVNSENNNDYSNEEEYEDDKASQDIVILDDDKSITPKEVIDIKKIKLVEKTDNDIINNKSSLSENNTKTKITKNKIIPELEQMCSEKEINEREKEKDLDRFEIDASSFPAKKADKSRMIQKYKRKRGKLLDLNDPKEIRSISALDKSINYLIEEILDSDKIKTIIIPDGFSISPMDIIQFIADRFTAIYKTMGILIDNDNNILNNSKFVENIGKMIRTIITFFNIGLDYFDDESPKEINSLIDNLLLPLLEYIKDIIINEEKYQYNLSLKNKDEFMSYYLFIKLKKDRNNFVKIYQEINNIIKNNESKEKMELVNNIYNILKNKDYVKFIKIIKNNNKCNYLISCFMSLFFNEIRADGLMKLSLEHEELSYKQILDYLIFEDNEEVRKFLIWYGITKDKSKYIVNDIDMVPLKTKKTNFDYEDAPQKTNNRYVEHKLNDKLRKDIVSEKIEFIENKNYNKVDNNNNINKKSVEEKKIIKNVSLINSDISKDKISQDVENKDIINNNSNTKKDIINNNILNESFISKGSFNQLFPSSTNKKNLKLNININKENINNSEKKITSPPKDEFLKPLSPKKNSFDLDKKIIIDNNKSLDLFSQPSISSIEGSKYYPNFNDQTIEFFCEVMTPIINRTISERKLDFIYRLKFIAEKYKIKLELIENYINRRKFFVFHELKKCCLNKKFSKEYYKELVNYNNNLNSQNTNENIAFKMKNQNIINYKKFELLNYKDIIYFLIKDFDILEQKKYDEKNEEIELINHLQINIYTTKDLIKTTKIISSLNLNKSLLKDNNDENEFTIIDNNIYINSNNKLSLIIKFIFVDQIIDLDSYIYDNQKSISKYSILIPFFDIIKSDPENQQILTKFFTILDLGLGSFIKKDIIFFFIKRDIDENSDLYKDYQNIQNDFIFNLMQKYSTNANKNNIIYVDDNYDNNEKTKERVIYLSPIDEYGKCYQEYIKYLNNKTFVELFEKNKLFHLNAFNPKEKLISFEKHIFELDSFIKFYKNTIENDLQNYLNNINCLKYFYNNKLCIEILIGVIIVKILLIYYQCICLSFANELFRVPFYNSSNELLLLEDNLLNSGSIFKQINIDGYNNLWKKYFSLDIKKKKKYFYVF